MVSKKFISLKIEMSKLALTDWGKFPIKLITNVSPFRYNVPKSSDRILGFLVSVRKLKKRMTGFELGTFRCKHQF